MELGGQDAFTKETGVFCWRNVQPQSRVFDRERIDKGLYLYEKSRIYLYIYNAYLCYIYILILFDMYTYDHICLIQIDTK